MARFDLQPRTNQRLRPEPILILSGSTPQSAAHSPPHPHTSADRKFTDSTGFCGGQKRYHAKSLKIKSGNVLPQRHHKICGQAKTFIFESVKTVVIFGISPLLAKIEIQENQWVPRLVND